MIYKIFYIRYIYIYIYNSKREICGKAFVLILLNRNRNRKKQLLRSDCYLVHAKQKGTGSLKTESDQIVPENANI